MQVGEIERKKGGLPSLSLAGLQSKFGSNVDFLLSVVHGVLVPR
jgi:hypothetical protein